MKLAKMLFVVSMVGSVALACAQTVYYRGRGVDLSGNDRPYRANGVLMVSARALAVKVDVRYDQNSAGSRVDLYFKGNHIAYRPGDRSYMMNGRKRTMREESDNRNGRIFLPFEMFEVVSDRAISLDRGSWRPDRPDDDRPVLTIEYLGKTLDYGRNEQPYKQSGTVMVALDRTLRQIRDVRDERDRRRNLLFLIADRREVEYEFGTRSYRLDGRRRDMRARSEERDRTLFVPIDLFEALIGRDIRAGWERD